MNDLSATLFLYNKLPLQSATKIASGEIFPFLFSLSHLALFLFCAVPGEMNHPCATLSLFSNPADSRRDQDKSSLCTTTTGAAAHHRLRNVQPDGRLQPTTSKSAATAE